MTRISSAILLVLSTVMVPVAGALAQETTNNPDNMAGVTGSQVATPQRPSGNSNPALTTGTLPKAAEAGVPADKNPNVGGATGHTIVPGTTSTIAGDRKETTREKTNK